MPIRGLYFRVFLYKRVPKSFHSFETLSPTHLLDFTCIHSGRLPQRISCQALIDLPTMMIVTLEAGASQENRPEDPVRWMQGRAGTLALRGGGNGQNRLDRGRGGVAYFRCSRVNAGTQPGSSRCRGDYGVAAGTVSPAGQSPFEVRAMGRRRSLKSRNPPE